MTWYRATHAEIFLCLFIAACATRAPQETPPPEPEPEVVEHVEPTQPTPEIAEPAEPDEAESLSEDS